MAGVLQNILIQNIKSVLEEFCEESSITDDVIKVSAWDGKFVIDRVVLRKKVFESIGVPMTLHHGSIGKIEIFVPWTSLGTDSVVVHVENVCLLIGPKYEWSTSSGARRDSAVKYAKLLSAELFASQRLGSSSGGSSSSSISSSFLQGMKEASAGWVAKSFVGDIVKNMKLTICNVHIRYEDSISCNSNFCFGFMMDSLNFKPVSAQNETMEDTRHIFGKKLEIKRNAVYWNPLSKQSVHQCYQPLATLRPLDIEKTMWSLMSKSKFQFADSHPHRYLISPLDTDIDFIIEVDQTSKAIKVRPSHVWCVVIMFY